MVALVWDIVLAFLIGIGGVLVSVLGLYLIVALARAMVQLLRGDFDKNRSERIITSSKDKK